jgi:hypothetical protein
MNSGSLHLGNYNSSATHFNTSIEHPADINRSLSLQVQGTAYIKQLSHGLPRRASSTALADGGESGGAQKSSSPEVEIVEDRPHVLVRPGRQLVINNLALNISLVADSQRGSVVSAAYYQITVSGAGAGGECSGGNAGGYAVFSAQYVVTPLLIGNLSRLHVKQVLGAEQATEEADSLVASGVTGHSIDQEILALTVQLLDCGDGGSRELVVDAKRVGRQVTQPAARILKSDDGVTVG